MQHEFMLHFQKQVAATASVTASAVLTMLRPEGLRFYIYAFNVLVPVYTRRLTCTTEYS